MTNLRQSPSGPEIMPPASLIANDSSVPGPTVKEALDYLLTEVGPDQIEVLYVGKHGDDTNDGKKIETAKKTFTAAAVAAIGTGINNQYALVCVDAGRYVESFALPQYVHVVAPAAVLEGYYSLNTYCRFIAGEIRGSGAPANVLVSVGATNVEIRVRKLICGSGDSGINNGGSNLNAYVDYLKIDGGYGFVHNAGARSLNAFVNHIEVVNAGTAIYSNSAPGVHSNYSINTVECTGVGCTGIDNQGAGTINARITRLDCDTAYNIVPGSTLNLVAASITGTRTALAGSVVNVTEAAIDSRVFIFGANSTLVGAGALYLIPGIANVAPLNADTARIITPKNGIVRNLHIKHNVAGGPAGPTITYTVMINGVASAVTATIAATAGSGSDLVNSVAVNAGDELSIRLTKSAPLGAAVLRPFVSLEVA